MSPEGTCLKITERAFINHPIKDIGKISPKMYVTHDSTMPPHPKYFRESVIHSFEDPKERAKFLLQISSVPDVWTNAPESQKVGCYWDQKTTWASAFLGIIRRKFIASTTQEN